MRIEDKSATEDSQDEPTVNMFVYFLPSLSCVYFPIIGVKL